MLGWRSRNVTPAARCSALNSMPSSVSWAASPTGALMSFARLARMPNAAAPAQANRLLRGFLRGRYCLTMLPLVGVFLGRELRATAHHRAHNLDVLDLGRIHRMRILGKHDE